MKGDRCTPVQLEQGVALVHGGDLDDEDRAMLQRIVDAVPPLTNEQIERQHAAADRRRARRDRLGIGR